MPDDAEAYVEVEVRELNGDKTTVETKDGRVGPRSHCVALSSLNDD